MAVRTSSGGKADWSLDNITFTNVPEVTHWDLSVEPEAKEYASSSTGGAKRRVAGNEGWSGSVEMYVDAGARFDAAPLGIRGGVTGWFKLYEDATRFFLAPAYIDSVEYTVDIESGDIIGATVNYSNNGSLTYPT
jgi:hypothetical protein